MSYNMICRLALLLRECRAEFAKQELRNSGVRPELILIFEGWNPPRQREDPESIDAGFFPDPESIDAGFFICVNSYYTNRPYDHWIIPASANRTLPFQSYISKGIWRQGIGSLVKQSYVSTQCPVEKYALTCALLWPLCEPLPCDPAAETTLHPPIWCSESASSYSSLCSGGVFFFPRVRAWHTLHSCTGFTVISTTCISTNHKTSTTCQLHM